MEENLIRKKLGSIKTELKCWESMFFRSHGRKPNKNDISSSGNEMRGAYKEYSNLKEMLLKITTNSSAPDNMRTDSNNEQNQFLHTMDEDKDFGVFGVNLNKKENRIHGKGSSHIKHHSLADRHKVTNAKIQHIKSQVLSNTCLLGNQKKTLNVPAVKKVDQTEATHEKTDEIQQTTELNTADIIHQHFDITTNLANEMNCPRKVSYGKKNAKSNTLIFNVSKGWLEKVRPVDEPDDSVFMPFKTFEESKNDIIFENNASDEAFPERKSTTGNGEEVMDQEALVHENKFTSVNREENCPLIKDSCRRRVRDIHTNVGDQGNGICNSNATKDLFDDCGNIAPVVELESKGNLKETNVMQGPQLDHSVPGGEMRGKGKINKTECIDSKIACLQSRGLEITVNMERMMKSKRKRKHLDNERNGNELEESVDDQSVGKVSKRMKKDSSLDSVSTVSRGKRLVSENFVTIDIQKKKYCRGKRRIKGSTYKRQQWKKKSQFSKQNTSNGYQYKKSGHWVNEYNNGSKGNQRKYSSNVEKKMEDYKPIHQSEDETGCSAFSFYDIPDLPRCWPRFPYRATCGSPPVAPLFNPVKGKPSQDAIKEVNKALKILGYSSFRHGQENAVARIVSGLSTLLVLSTGSGKSLCYQLPAYLYYKKAKYLTIVISPLVALMEDQVANLPHGIKGACLHTNMTKTQREKVIQDVSNSKIAILLLSPEALISGSSSTGYLPMLRNLPPIAFVCIDEAHCISEWSHNFRPSYLRVCQVLRDNFGILCFLGLTATSTKSTSLSVTKHLGISDSETETAIIKGTTMPDNLRITVSREEDRDRALVKLLTCQKFSKCTSVIIYCTRRDETERLSSVLRTCLKCLPPTELDVSTKDKLPIQKGGKKGKRKTKPQAQCVDWDADFYHAGMTPAQRKKVQMRFMTGELRIVVATTAFGMGLDKADVRAIIHYNMPKSFESFLQEIGRAGRDGLLAYCHIFLDKEGMDLCELRRHTYGNSVDFKTIKKLVNSIYKTCDCKERLKNSKNTPPNGKHCCKENIDGNQVETFATDLCAKGSDSNTKENEVSKGIFDKDFMLDDVDHTACNLDVHHDYEILEFDHPKRPAMSANNCCSPNDDYNDKQSDLQGSDNYLAQSTSPLSTRLKRCCSGHHVTLSIEENVLALDMREENIATLLSYLEHLPDSSVLLLGTLQSCCTVKCYGGPKQMKMLAKGFLPLTAVFNRMRRENLILVDNRAVTFNIVEIADDLGWDLDPIYRELRSLQWNTKFAMSTNDSLIGKSGILVEFDNMSFHVIAPGDLSDDERDHICSTLYETIKHHEQTRLLQLDALYNIFDCCSKEVFPTNFDESDPKADKHLRKCIEDYFECDTSEMNSFLERLTPNRIQIPVPEQKWDVIARDIRTMLNLHHDVVFNGRALARIFHGIDSPCYPATVWGRDRRFWRRYLDVPFHELCKFITAEIIKYRT